MAMARRQLLVGPFTAFLFTNRARDCLLLFSTDRGDDQTMMKKLEKGARLFC
jgi:hypothetical protein